MRSIGLHLRIQKNFAAVARYAYTMGLPSFQCFLIDQTAKKHIVLQRQDVQRFLAMRHYFGSLYVHGAYWINLCAADKHISTTLLKKELRMAEQLQFTHYVMHPGATTQWPTHYAGIDAMIKILNEILRDTNAITIVLENTAHGVNSVGSDIRDFLYIKERLNFPEKVGFCIDTAHAHAFGYDLINDTTRQDFIALIEQYIGIDSVALIHLNDAREPLGLKKDIHAPVGYGVIGQYALQQFILDRRLAHVPVIMEPPESKDYNPTALLATLRSWHTL